MSLGISSGMFSSALGGKSAGLPSQLGATESSFGEMFQEAQGYLDNPTGMGLGTSTGLDEAEDSLSRMSDGAFNAVKMQIQTKLQALMEKQRAEEQSGNPDLAKTDKLVQFAHHLGGILDDETRRVDHEKAGELLDKVLIKLQGLADAGDLDAQAFLMDLV